MKRTALIVLSILVGLIGTAVGVSAQVAPSGGGTVEIQTHDENKDCDSSFHQTGSYDFMPLPGTEVTVRAGTGVKDVVVDLSAELAVTGNSQSASGQIGYSIDGGPFVASGPSIFNNANITQWNTESFTTVLQFKGTHTIRAGFRLHGGSAVTAIVLNRCLIARVGPK